MKRLLPLLLCLSLLFAAAPLPSGTRAVAEDATYAPMQYGASGEDVAAIQEQLKALGYYSGKVSGNFLDGTRAAVKLFQQDYELSATGIVDGETEAVLMNAEYRALATGDSGEDVLRLQETLTRLGYYNGKLSGDYLEGTTAGIKAFQQNNEMIATGDADVQTQRILFGADARAKDAPSVTPAPGNDLGDINDVVMAADGEGEGETVDIEYKSKLKRGAMGDQVKLLQQRLSALGYFTGPISGNYMNQTTDAIKQFQTNNALKVDGITGEDTWTMLFDDKLALPVNATPRPTPVPTPVPYAVTVDVQNQAITVYGLDEGGQYTKVVRRMVCSTGMVGTPSTTGEFVLNGKRARWAYFSLYGSYAQYWTRINKYIAFHSVIYNAVNYSSLNHKSYNLLGSRASHGCIRLLVSDAKWMYDNMGEGVKVTITDGLPNDPELRAALKPPPLSEKYDMPIETPQPTDPPAYTSDGMPPLPLRTMKKGDSGADVYWLQMKLTELGYYKGTVTGTFLGGTQNAVKAYQRVVGIYPDGKVGDKTLNALYPAALSTSVPPPPTPAQPTQAPTPSPMPSPTKAPTPGTVPTPVPTAAG